MKVEERLADRLGYHAPDGLFLAEFYLAFCRVNIDIHQGGIQLEEKAAERVAAFHEHVVIAFYQGEIETPILHRPAVHEQMLVEDIVVVVTFPRSRLCFEDS